MCPISLKWRLASFPYPALPPVAIMQLSASTDALTRFSISRKPSTPFSCIQEAVYTFFLNDLSQSFFLRFLDQDIGIYEIISDHFGEYYADSALSGRRHSDQYKICLSHFPDLSFTAC